MKYRPINGWTRQSIIEVIKARNSDEPATMLDECGWRSCVYKTARDNRCAIGLFIPDDHEALRATNTNVSGLLRIYPDLKSVMPLEGNALTVFQGVHDAMEKELCGVKLALIEWVEKNVA